MSPLSMSGGSGFVSGTVLVRAIYGVCSRCPRSRVSVISEIALLFYGIEADVVGIPLNDEGRREIIH